MIAMTTNNSIRENADTNPLARPCRRCILPDRPGNLFINARWFFALITRAILKQCF